MASQHLYLTYLERYIYLFILLNVKFYNYLEFCGHSVRMRGHIVESLKSVSGDVINSMQGFVSWLNAVTNHCNKLLDMLHGTDGC